jgi:hypothetical protein
MKNERFLTQAIPQIFCLKVQILGKMPLTKLKNPRFFSIPLRTGLEVARHKNVFQYLMTFDRQRPLAIAVFNDLLTENVPLS